MEALRVELALRRPMRSAHGIERVRDLVLVRLVAGDGIEGWGECSTLSRPTYTAEHTDGAWRALVERILPAMAAGGPVAWFDPAMPMASAAVSTALADQEARRVGTPLGRLLAEGAAVRDRVATCAVIGRGSTAEVLAGVQDGLGAGVAMVKLKVTPASADLEAVAAVRSEHPDLALAVDFNGSGDRDSIRRLDRLGLVYIEQPAPAGDLVASAALGAETSSPIALDEGLGSAADVAAAAAAGAARIANVKPARLGGPVAAVTVARAAADIGWGVFVGGMLEGGIGRAAALAVAAQECIGLPTDLGPSSRYFDRDVVAPLELDPDGMLAVPGGQGLGVAVDGAALDAAVVDRWRW